MWRDWVEQGADASTMRILCPTTRVVAMGITPQLVWLGELELKRFLTHELYHAFQQDLPIEGKCRELSEDEATANTPMDGGRWGTLLLILRHRGGPWRCYLQRSWGRKSGGKQTRADGNIARRFKGFMKTKPRSFMSQAQTKKVLLRYF